jgi:group I intron endonuclease
MSKFKIIGIYKITSPSGKIYIGQGVDVLHRFYIYKKLLCKQQTKLYHSFCKYGVENHKFEIIHECNENELNDLEIKYINQFNTFNTDIGLNLLSGGSNGRHNDETKLKISESRIGDKNPNYGKKMSQEQKDKISIANKGRKLSKETIDRIIKSKTGVISSFRGKKQSEEAKIKMSQAKKGKCFGSDNNFYGKKHSDETKKKISESNKGRKSLNKGMKISKELI